jgi:hypothetical protein
MGLRMGQPDVASSMYILAAACPSASNVVGQCSGQRSWYLQVLTHVPPLQRERVGQLLLAAGYLRSILDIFRVGRGSLPKEETCTFT